MTSEQDPLPETQTPPSSPQRRCRISQRSLGTLIVAVVVVGMVSAKFVLFVIDSREAINRSICRGHFKHLILALHNYADVHGGFPPAYTVDADGKPLHSWRTLILPYLDQNKLYESIDLSKPWDDPANAHARAIQIPTYTCRSVSLPTGFTTYQGIVGPEACLHPTESRKLMDIRDGASSTAILVEVPKQDAVHWMSPIDHGKQFLLNMGHENLVQPHDRLCLVMADGQVGSVSPEFDTQTFSALININDGVPVCEVF